MTPFDLDPSTLARVARLRADGNPWPLVAEETGLDPENLDLLPLLHPDWRTAYREAARESVRHEFAEAQNVTRSHLKYAALPEIQAAAMKRVTAKKPRRRKGKSGKPPFAVRPGSALAKRLELGETLEGIGAGYLAGLVAARSEMSARSV